MTRRRRSWTHEEKIRIATEARDRLRRGERQKDVAKSLEIEASTLIRWLRRLDAPDVIQRVRLLAPRTVAQEAAPAMFVGRDPGAKMRTISIRTPDGFIFDGLNVDTAIQLFGRIGEVRR